MSGHQTTGLAPETYPVKPGDWVAARYDAGRVAKVKQVHRHGDEVLVDLILFSRSGEQVGRESPIMGGPRTFEPSCDYANWQRIETPEFPISLKWVPSSDGRLSAGYHHGGNVLADRSWVRPVRRLPGSARPTNQPEVEAAALRRAAQELRDAARRPEGPGLLDRAAVLDKLAKTLETPL